MYVIITYKYEKDPIKKSREKVETSFSHDKPKGIFLNVKGQLTPQSMVQSGRYSNLSELSCMSSLPASRVGTSIFQPVNSSGKCRKIPAWQILQKSLKWQILAFMNKSKLKTCEIKNLLLYFAKNDTGTNHNSISKMSKMHHFMI